MRILSALANAVMMPVLIVAQNTGSIVGVVTDQHGAVPQGADIVAVHSSGASFRALTDRNGRFRLGDLVPGRYRVTVSIPGMFKPFDTSQVEVLAGQQVEMSPLLEFCECNCETKLEDPAVIKLEVGEDLLDRGRMYDVSVYRDGTVIYEGKNAVLIGKRVRRISPKQVEALLAELDASGFFGFEDCYGHVAIDVGWTALGARMGAKNKRVVQQHTASPGSLERLYRRILEVTGTNHWIEYCAKPHAGRN